MPGFGTHAKIQSTRLADDLLWVRRRAVEGRLGLWPEPVGRLQVIS